MGTDTELPLDAGAALTQNWVRSCLCCRDDTKPLFPASIKLHAADRSSCIYKLLTVPDFKTSTKIEG